MVERVPVRKGLFVDGAEGLKLVGNRCRACGQSYFPKAKLICLNCESEDLEEIQFAPRGRLYSYASSNVPTQHFRPPFVVGYITLENDVRIASQLVEVEGKPFKIGMEMGMLTDTLWTEGNVEVFGYKFKPV